MAELPTLSEARAALDLVRARSMVSCAGRAGAAAPSPGALLRFGRLQTRLEAAEVLAADNAALGALAAAELLRAIAHAFPAAGAPPVDIDAHEARLRDVGHAFLQDTGS